MNYLRPDLKHGNFSAEEDELIVKLFEELGTKWSTIASKILGRTDNEIKNYSHAHLKKQVARWTKIKNITGSPSTSSSSSSHLQHPDIENNHDHNSKTEEMDMDMAHHHHPLAETTILPPILESSLLPPELSSRESYNHWGTSSKDLKHVNVVSDEFGMESFSFPPEHSPCESFNHPSTSSNLKHVMNDDVDSGGFRMESQWDRAHFWYEQVQREEANNDASYSTSGGDFWTEPFVVMDDSDTLCGGDMSYETTTLMFDDDLESLMYSVMRELPDTSF